MHAKRKRKIEREIDSERGKKKPQTKWPVQTEDAK